ncbi:cupin domain-containing protein [Altererythrobacter salegens]|uniref:Cupin domain-containing protein n=1 Tax=Croceibacterium salegens TaxID=1737568 RepID=A0A6I4ST95_9SPHN|nr:cupin domain-containing protein [Croceibacterium salegens]MXO58227.1 cupin domain-containing protein [Croceibacterium salegens]
MAVTPPRVVTGHDADGKSVILSDGLPPQEHPMHGAGVGADFLEIWSSAEAVPSLTSTPDAEPSLRPFTIMPPTGHLIRMIELCPPSMGGRRTVMHRTRTLDYAVVLEGEVVLVLDDSVTVLGPGAIVVQRGTDHAWENRSDAVTRMAFFHIAAEFSDELLAKLPQPLDLME